MASNTEVSLRNELELQKWQVTRMRVDVKTLQAENRRLRKVAKNGKAGRIAHRANADARQLCAWRFSGYTITRRQCHEYGMSERRWCWAIAMLRLADVVAMRGNVDDFKIEEFNLCISAIDKATRKVEINGLSLLIFRMAKGRVVTPKR